MSGGTSGAAILDTLVSPSPRIWRRVRVVNEW